MHQPLILDRLVKKQLDKQEFKNLKQLEEFFILWQKHLESEKVLVEEQWRQRFLGDLFNLLEYELGKNYKFEGKTEVDSTKPDATLSTNFENGVEVVVEWKGSDIVLDKNEKKNGKSIGDPIYQAFGYLSGFGGCKWYIVGNFKEIRLFHRDKNRSEYQLFLLSELATDVQKIKELALFLSAENLLKNGKEKSKIDELFDSNYKEKEAIANEFYKTFKAHRLSLYHHLINKNTNLEWNDNKFLAKAQSILDKLTFVQFASSRELVSPKFLDKYVIKQRSGAIDITGNLNFWFWLRQAFGAIDRGATNTNPAIFGYNGELFKTDLELENLEISDEILLPILEFFDSYDFANDLSLDILGHIFENSISDLEKIRGGELESARNVDGVFYTSENITKYITQKCVDLYLENNPNCITENGFDLKLLDPACGSGAFLNQAHTVLLEKHREFAKKDSLVGESDFAHLGREYEEYDIKQSILHNNLYGVDLNSESVEITKLSLWLKTIEKNKKMQSLVKNIKQGNSLIGFDWKKEFGNTSGLKLTVSNIRPSVFGTSLEREKTPELKLTPSSGGNQIEVAPLKGLHEVVGSCTGKFDIITMNPPYVTLDKDSNKIYKTGYENSLEGKGNLFALFVERAFQLAIENAIIGFIVPNTLLSIKSFAKIRQFILQNSKIKNVINLKYEAFPGAETGGTCIIILQKTKNNSNNFVNYQECTNSQDFENITDIQIIQLEQDKLLTNSDFAIKDTQNLTLSKITKPTIKLGEIASVTFGLQTQSKDEYVKDFKVDEQWENCYTGRDIHRYSLDKSTLYFKNNFKEVKAGGSWDMKIHHSKKIVVRQIGNPEPIFALDTFGYASLCTMYNIVSTSEIYDLKYVLGVLNSEFVKSYWSENFSENKDLFPKIKGYQLKELPIPVASQKEQEVLVVLAQQMLDLNTSYSEILHKHLNYFTKTLRIEISKKMQKLATLEWADYLALYQPKKQTLSFSQKQELMQDFENTQQQLLQIQTQLDSTDLEINQKVSQLYGISILH